MVSLNSSFLALVEKKLWVIFWVSFLSTFWEKKLLFSSFSSESFGSKDLKCLSVVILLCWKLLWTNREKAFDLLPLQKMLAKEQAFFSFYFYYGWDYSLFFLFKSFSLTESVDLTDLCEWLSKLLLLSEIKLESLSFILRTFFLPFGNKSIPPPPSSRKSWLLDEGIWISCVYVLRMLFLVWPNLLLSLNSMEVNLGVDLAERRSWWCLCPNENLRPSSAIYFILVVCLYKYNLHYIFESMILF